ncbi:unnamed protein product [Callosobruchus maculatus]|uniref:Carboxylic ester hydrolase n=1 Tax=Callosobruchus maculatus TaxID=64391 RepID=A0A653DAI8_CALMS|nr:unnamed protein product [Callosobruchus maculatus]
MYSFSVVLLCILQLEALRFLPKSEYNNSLQVKTTNGFVQGKELATENGRRFLAFRGVPFAEPPLGDLRFRSPQLPKKWDQVVDATEDIDSCIEVQARRTGFQLAGSEDCLYLNVYTPVVKLKVKEKNLPVFFFIYGGAFSEGTSSSSLYGPGHFIEQNSILVTANYRTGLFGFLSTQDLASPGNYGLKDQRLVLLWIQSNIRYFGGNPQKVVIMGQSAGGSSVMHHVVSPRSRGLFNAAVSLSGDTLTQWSNNRRPKSIAEDIALSLGIPFENTTKFIDDLRTLPTMRLQEANLEAVFVHTTLLLLDGLPFTPTIEVVHKDAFITDSTYNSLKKGDIAKVPILMGTTSLEALFFAGLFDAVRPFLFLCDWSPAILLTRLNIRYTWQKHLVAKMIKKAYFQGKFSSSATKEELAQYFSDILFSRPFTKTAKLLSKHTDVFFYVYDYPIPAVKAFYRKLGYFIDTHLKGCAHSEDLGCYFTSEQRPKDIKLSDRDLNHCRRMRKFLTNFAVFG